LQHLQHVGACYARAKKAIALNLTDVGNLVADGRNLADGSLESLLRVLCPAEAPTGILPDVSALNRRGGS
jgi:hypothetical protein